MSTKVKFARVIFFEYSERNDGSYDVIGATDVTDPGRALNIFSNTPNPPSQLIEGETVSEVELKTQERISQMMDPKWVKVKVEPYI